jgi:hypothetical protein
MTRPICLIGGRKAELPTGEAVPLDGVPYAAVAPGVYYPGVPFTGVRFGGLLQMAPDTAYFSPLELSQARQIASVAIDVVLPGVFPAFEMVSGPAWLSVTGVPDGTAVLSGTPSASDVGVHAVTIRASNGVETVDQSFSIEVT